MKGFKKYLLTLLISVSIFLVGVNYVNAEGTAGEILLTKTATKEDKEKGRSADVTLTVNANGFTTVDKTDVVLVLDRSTSMDGTSMKNTKEAANDLVNLLITDKTKDNTRAAIVTYGSDLLTSYTSNSLTNDATALKNTINSIPNSMAKQGTNVHAGLIKAEELLKNSGNDTQKIVILLSDGEPTYYIGTDNKRHGMGDSDNYEDDHCSWNYRKNIGECTEYKGSKNVVMTYENVFLSKIYTTKDAYKPSTNANNKATTMKADGTKIYTIGFGNGASGNAYEFLGKVASTPTDKYRYTASDYAGLKKAFNKIVNDFTTVATDAVVTDIVPAGFKIKEGTLPAGATSKENDDGTTTITWVIGDVKSTDNNKLTYTVEAKEGHYGSMYTNVSATINAKSVDGNPKYGSSNPISLDFDKPYVPIPGVTVKDDYTVDDKYDIKQGTTFITPTEKGILDNDELTHKNLDENATVTDRIVLVYDDETNGKAENITLNQDGTFSYNAKKDTLGKITYKYYVETTVTIDGKSQVVRSNVTTITLNVIKNPTKYVVNYLEKGTDKVLHDAKSEDGNVYDEIKLADVIMTINGYNYDSVNVDPLVLSDNTVLNVMNIYYTKRTDLSYTVNYLEKDTNRVLNKSKEVKNVEFETVIKASNEIIAIDGYVFNSVNPQELTVGTNSNVINIYYTKRADLSYTVNYLEKDTNKVLN
ncbi:MAG: vWA domain-containing protein, partial [bacterium]|nr:vWA domain-containing protein [bacterium]